MARRGRARIDGLADALRAIGRIPAAANEARSETLHEWADAVEEGAEQRAPVRTGYLKSKIDQRIEESAGTAEVGVYDQRALEYAEHVEKGTESMADQPFLLPSFDAERPQVPRTYRAAFLRHMRGE